MQNIYKLKVPLVVDAKAGDKGTLSKLVSDQREKAVERLQKALQRM